MALGYIETKREQLRAVVRDFVRLLLVDRTLWKFLFVPERVASWPWAWALQMLRHRVESHWSQAHSQLYHTQRGCRRMARTVLLAQAYTHCEQVLVHRV